ncbi:MAG TPA: hypothetical protein VHP83_21910 [Aggregatilineaceae bacterium]|nr:hypothetical protein [Aggregatilineaceae bacterium]
MRWLAVVCLILMITTPVWAQDDEPDTGKISRANYEIVFPAVLRFSVDIDAPMDEIGPVTLDVRQESGLRQTFVLQNLEDYATLSDETTTILVYTWDLTSGPVPVPTEPLNFIWQVETTGGEVSTLADEFIFEDSRHGVWQAAGQPPLILYWSNENLGGASLRDEVMSAYDLLTRRTGTIPTFRIAIYDPGIELCETYISPETGESSTVVTSWWDGARYPCSAEIYKDVYQQTGVLFVQRQTRSYTDLQDLLISAITREAYLDSWGTQPVPAWFVQGLGMLYRLHPNAGALQLVQASARTDTLLDLDDLTEAPPPDATFQERSLWEAQSYLLTLYLADQYGATAPFDLAQAIPGQGFENAFAAITGGDQTDLEQKWTRWLFTEAAGQAVTWMPYSPVTPTPSNTPTITPLPPSRTPTATRTATPTATSTSLVDRPPTTIAERVTPTRAARATNTPRPPGSLPTVTPRATPAPAVSESEESNSSISTGAVIGLAALGIVLVAALAAFMSRKR